MTEGGHGINPGERRAQKCSEESCVVKINIGWLTGGLKVELEPNTIKTMKRSCTLSKLCRIQNVKFPSEGKEGGGKEKKEHSVW